MISIKELKNCERKNIKVYFTDGNTREGYCECYQPPQDDDEEYMLEMGYILINQSEIEKVEILD